MFWVKVLILQMITEKKRAVNDSGSVPGFVKEVNIQEPNGGQEGEVWIRVRMDANGRLIFDRYFGPPTLIRFLYDKLRKFYTRCGALTYAHTEYDYEEPNGELQ